MSINVNTKLSLIYPLFISVIEEEFDNMPYDVSLTMNNDELSLNVTTFSKESDNDNLEDCSKSYYACDEPFTNLMVENFTHLKNQYYISSPDSDTKSIKSVLTFTPPTPPKNISKSSLDLQEYCKSSSSGLDIGDGNFDFIDDKLERTMLENAWQAITQTNTWDFLSQDIESFIFTIDPCIDIISKKMKELGYDGHSGSSFGSTMRNMQFLAKNGENKFKEMFTITPHSDKSEENSDIESEPY